MHHMEEVAEDAGDEPSNLLPLCPTCHALFHRGEIQRDSIYAWKAVLVSLSHAFDVNTIDDLLFLCMPETQQLGVTADGVLRFSRLIASGLATFQCVMRNNSPEHYMAAYRVILTAKGLQLATAWKSGNREAVTELIGSGGATMTARARTVARVTGTGHTAATAAAHAGQVVRVMAACHSGATFTAHTNVKTATTDE